MAGPTPGTSLNAGSCLVGCALALRARGPDFRLPPAPAGGRDRYRILMIGDRDGRGRGRAAVLRAGRRDRHRQAAGQRHDPGAQRHPPGRSAAGDERVRHHPPPAAEMADWLRSWQVERAGMEATSDYWKPVYFVLEREGLGCLLYQVSQVKALPGRPKTDRLDSACWPGSPSRDRWRAA